jgi:hypothetical protein
MQFAKQYVQNKTPEQLKTFFDKASKTGALSPKMMQTLLQTRPDLNPQQIAEILKDGERMQTQYTVMHELVVKKATQLAQVSIGAKNPALGMINFKNILLTVGQLASVMSIAGNVMTHMFHEGEFNFVSGLKGLMTDEYFLGAVGALGAIHLYRGKAPEVSGKIAEGEKKLLDLMNREPKVERALKENNYSMSYFLSQFIRANSTEDGATVKSNLTIYDFTKFMEEQGKKDPKEQKLITEGHLIEKAQTLKGEREGTFSELLQDFSQGNVFGPSPEGVGKAYEQALSNAREIPKPQPTNAA